jgi:hypothetical protein
MNAQKSRRDLSAVPAPVAAPVAGRSSKHLKPTAERVSISDRRRPAGLDVSEEDLRKRYRYDHRLDGVTP